MQSLPLSYWSPEKSYMTSSRMATKIDIAARFRVNRPSPARAGQFTFFTPKKKGSHSRNKYKLAGGGEGGGIVWIYTWPWNNFFVKHHKNTSFKPCTTFSNIPKDIWEPRGSDLCLKNLDCVFVDDIICKGQIHISVNSYSSTRTHTNSAAIITTLKKSKFFYHIKSPYAFKIQPHFTKLKLKV